MQVQAEYGKHTLLPIPVVAVPVMQAGEASAAAATGTVCGAIACDQIISAEAFIIALPKIIKLREFEILVRSLQKFGQDEEVLCRALGQIAVCTESLSATDLNKLAHTAESTFTEILVALVRDRRLSVPIQKSGLAIVSYMCSCLGAAFPPHLIIPVAALCLENMAGHPGDMYLQRIACATLNNLSKQDLDVANIGAMRTAGGFDLVHLVLAFCSTVCLTESEALGFGVVGHHFVRNLVHSRQQSVNAQGTLCFLYELLCRFAGTWMAPQRVGADRHTGIEDGIVRTMRAFPNYVSVQERGCAALGRLARHNVAQFNQSSLACISTVLQIMQTTGLWNAAHGVACRTLHSFLGVHDVATTEMTNINKHMQNILGETGAIPLVLRNIKYHYEMTRAKSAVGNLLQDHIHLLAALVTANADNCRRVYLANGVTLLVAVVVSFRTKRISQIEISCVQALCSIFKYAETLHADVYMDMRLSACEAKKCPSTNPSNQKKKSFSALDVVTTAAHKRGIPVMLLAACSCMVASCSEVLQHQAAVAVAANKSRSQDTQT